MKRILILSTLLLILNNCSFFEQFDSRRAYCEDTGDGYCTYKFTGEKFKW